MCVLLVLIGGNCTDTLKCELHFRFCDFFFVPLLLLLLLVSFPFVDYTFFRIELAVLKFY